MHSDAPNSVLLGSFGAKANNKMVCQILIINHKNCLPSISGKTSLLKQNDVSNTNNKTQKLSAVYKVEGCQSQLSGNGP